MLSWLTLSSNAWDRIYCIQKRGDGMLTARKLHLAGEQHFVGSSNRVVWLFHFRSNMDFSFPLRSQSTRWLPFCWLAYAFEYPLGSLCPKYDGAECSSILRRGICIHQKKNPTRSHQNQTTCHSYGTAKRQLVDHNMAAGIYVLSLSCTIHDKLLSKGPLNCDSGNRNICSRCFQDFCWGFTQVEAGWWPGQLGNQGTRSTISVSCFL